MMLLLNIQTVHIENWQQHSPADPICVWSDIHAHFPCFSVCETLAWCSTSCSWTLAWIVCSSFADFLPFGLLTCTALLYNSAFNASIVITKAVLAALRCFVLLHIQCKHCSWQFSLAVHYCCLKNQRSSQHAGTRIIQLQHPSLRLLISEKGHQHMQTAGTAKVVKDDGCFL